jgi:hypothetical protein
MIHLEVCSLLLFGQKNKTTHGVGPRGRGARPFTGPQTLLILSEKPNKLEDINLSNNATNYSTILLNYQPKMQIFLQILQIRESPFRDSKFHSILLFQPLLVCHRGLLYQDII